MADRSPEHSARFPVSRRHDVRFAPSGNLGQRDFSVCHRRRLRRCNESARRWSQSSSGLTGAQLDLSNASLDANAAYEDTASMRTISEAAPPSFSALLRGSSSLGTLYANNGFPSVPSATDPGPDGDSYFSGGDNTRRHTCGAEATAYGGGAARNLCGG